MVRTLEKLEFGTPVYCGEQRVGDVRAIYAEGSARSVEWVVVSWEGRGDIAVPAVEVESIDDRGVELIQSDPHFYDDLSPFSEDRFPTVHKLA
jgi:hypothetical protein